MFNKPLRYLLPPREVYKQRRETMAGRGNPNNKNKL